MNKTLQQIVLVAFCGTILLSGCQKRFIGEDSFKVIHVQKQARLTSDTLSPACSLDIAFTYACGEDSATEKINGTLMQELFQMESVVPVTAAVDSFIARYTQNYRAEMQPYYQADKGAGEEETGWYNYFYNLTTEVHDGKAGIVNYVADINTYEGGAHGNHVCSYWNFDAQNGKLITLDDVFLPDYEGRLNDILLQALMEQTETRSLEALQNKGYLMWSSIYPSQNFLLKTDAIEFLYNVYEIAPYVCGMTILRIPYAKLTDILAHP